LHPIVIPFFNVEAIMYVLEGPADCGNVFGLWKPSLVPAGRWTVVEDGEYANGGYGPSTVDGRLYLSRAAADNALADRVRDRVPCPG
jgi:hypothetical protein